MPDRDFCLWLQGFFELTGATEVTEAQTKMIKEHLALVFNKVTPPLDNPWVPGTPLGLDTIKPVYNNPNDFLSRPTIIC